MTASTLTQTVPLGPRLVPVPAARPRLATRPLPAPVARPRPAVPALGVVDVEWDGLRGLHVAVCDRCCETLDALHLGQAHEWAETHRCDPELAALLAEVLDRRAA